MRHTIKVGLLCLLLLGCWSSGSQAQAPVKTIDHTYSAYGSLLNEYVADGLVDYNRLLPNRSHLDILIDDIATVNLSSISENQRLAFYINSYNLITLRSIIDHYPLKSIKDIDGVWDKTKWDVAGKKLTLNQIEHEVLRKEFNEPRIHFAIVCASIGCPPLSNKPYLPDTIDEQLTNAARLFATSPEYNRFDPEKGTAELSSIFDWFGDDFIEQFYNKDSFPSLSQKKNAVVNFLIAQYPKADQEKLSGATYDISYNDYDWSLNDKNSK
ncbi:MAG: DUF547 domain-containing protein [candidate division Zixibacteria bacterium]|nr:DUF547 domain-containing protein [candidate division Zixibacteria bacterium]